MVTDNKPSLVTINVDGVEHQVAAGANLIDALAKIGKEVPHYCYHPKLTVAGNCRMCLVELGSPMRDRATNELVMENGKTKIGWQPKPAIACATNVSPGLHVRLESPTVKACREGVTEMLLLNHPLDCPICDQAGECKLQEFSAEYGRGYSRYVDEKNAKPKKTRLGPRVTLDDERCILCSRCVRFSSEIAKDPVLGFVNRGSFNTLTCFPGRELDNNYSLNTVDICPVGALTSTDFRFKMRVWFLKQTPSIDTESSAGANTTVWSREGKIYRITPRQNDAVNDTWMADSGRELYKSVEAAHRVTCATVKQARVPLDEALQAASEALKSGPLAIVGSAHLSVEEQFLLARLAKANDATVYVPAHPGKGDGLLVSEDRTPNYRGALVTGLTPRAADANLSSLAADIDAGKVKSLLICREEVSTLGLSPSTLAKIRVVVMATHHGVTTAAAEIVLPGLTVFERSGSFINCQFRLQAFAQAIPGPVGVLPDAAVLARLAGINMANIWSELAAAVPALAGVNGALLPAEGVQLDSQTWAAHRFPETKLLKFAPVVNA
ncbi:MAG: 2Fe-2S iron-sulfur cluster-binding protein [Verrucomicrobiota bacterium]